MGVAAVVTFLLLLVLVGHGVVVLAVRGQLRAELSTLDSELAAGRLAREQAQADLRTRFQQADLPGRLRTVRSRDEAADAALLTWGTTGQPLSGPNTIRQARNDCAEAVIDHNATAARFPVDMLAGQPRRIDPAGRTTGCGR